MTTPPLDRLRHALRLQRLSMLAEQLWAAVQGPLWLAALACALLWSGLLESLPRPLPFIILAALVLTFAWSLRPLAKLRQPAAANVLRKLDAVNGLENREASSLGDQLVEGSGAAELWEAHLERKLSALLHLQLAWPASRWRNFDPLALRVPIAIAALSAFLLGGGTLSSGVINAAQLTTPVPAKPVTLDAWAKPPAYTGKPPLLLTSPAFAEKLKAGEPISLPENSGFSLRLANAAEPKVEVVSPGSNTAVALAETKTGKAESGFTFEAKLDKPATIQVLDGAKEVASFPISLVVDAPPKIAFSGEPAAKEGGQLAVKWNAADDYGVKSVTAEIGLSDTQEDGLGFASNGVFLYDPPNFKIALQKPGAKQMEQTSTADLAGHAWAGLYVEMTLTAEDGAGHKTTTAPKRFKLPERDFIKPLAQAFAEQRKKAILAPEDAADASTMLGAMLLYPVDIADNSGLILNLASVKARMANASAPEDVVSVVTDLWPLIIAIDEGSLADAKAELKNLAEQLKQALRDGAPQEKIDELTKRMREAMNKLMDQMQKEAKKRMADGARPRNGKPVSPDDLKKMLDSIEQLNREGSKESAEQMLSELDQLLQNLQPGQGAQANNGSPGAQEQMDALSGMMGKQRKLMDETQRMGQDGKDGQGQGLAGKQGDLKDQLGKLGQGLSGEEGGDSLGKAGKNMGAAEDALRKGDQGEALRQQNEAMRNLKEGMGKLGDKLSKEGQQGTGGAKGNADDDPLGRPRATHGGANTKSNLVPSELAMRRAREILEELRARANQQGLSDDTKAYIGRLLKNLY